MMAIEGGRGKNNEAINFQAFCFNEQGMTKKKLTINWKIFKLIFKNDQSVLGFYIIVIITSQDYYQLIKE